MNLDAASLAILWPAFIAGLLVTATHVPLGMQVLARGIVFIDLAVAQIAGVGVILADFLGWGPQGLAAWPYRFLCAGRVRRHRVGATRRALSGVCDARHTGTGDLLRQERPSPP